MLFEERENSTIFAQHVLIKQLNASAQNTQEKSQNCIKATIAFVSKTANATFANVNF